MIDEYLAELYRQFDKRELLQVAAELELAINERLPTRKLLKAIVEDLEAEGVPDAGDCSELMDEFLFAAEFIDEDGNLLDRDIEQDNKEEESEPEPEDIEKPECYTLADDRDPACNRCKVFKSCLKARMARRPECFGVAYSKHAEECAVCIEAPFCRLELEHIIKVD